MHGYLCRARIEVPAAFTQQSLSLTLIMHHTFRVTIVQVLGH